MNDRADGARVDDRRYVRRVAIFLGLAVALLLWCVIDTLLLAFGSDSCSPRR